MMRRTLFAVLTSGAWLLAFAAPPVLAAEPGTGQNTVTPTKTKVHAKKPHHGKAPHPAKAHQDSAARRPDTQGPLSLVVVGDIMLEDGPMDAMRKGQDPFAGFASLFAGADIRIGNLECVVATTGSPEDDKPNVFRVHPRALKYIKRHFDAVGLANNHSGDFGPQAFAQMLGLLKHNKIGVYGGGMNLSEAHAPWIIERKGVRVAILGYNEFQPRSFEALHDKAGVAWGEPDFIAQDIARARQHHRADIVITYPHWGWENEKKGNAQQQALAHWMIDSGADAVVGGHPHVTQNVEVYKGKPIFYSLGNFMFNGFNDKESNTGWVLKLTIGAAGDMDWKIHQVGLNRQGIPTDLGPLPTTLP